jgi:hypothetical protein
VAEFAMQSKKIPIVLVAVLVLGGVLRHAEQLRRGHGPITAVVVENSALRSAAQGAVIQALAERNGHGIDFHLAEPTSAGPDLAKIQWAIDAAKASKRSLPVVCLRHAGPSRVAVFPLPATPAAATALLARY